MTLDDMGEKVDAPHGKAALRGGLILGVFGIVFNLILYFAGLLTEQWAGWIAVPFVLVILFFIQKKFRDDDQNGFITFGKAWKLGFGAGAISTVLTAIFTFILYSMDSSLQEVILDQAYEDMVAEGSSTSEIEVAWPWVEAMTSPIAMFCWAFFIGLFFSLIWPLITSAIVQRKHPLD